MKSGILRYDVDGLSEIRQSLAVVFCDVMEYSAVRCHVMSCGVVGYTVFSSCHV